MATLSSRNPLLVTFFECLPAAVILTLLAAFRMGGLPPVRDLFAGGHCWDPSPTEPACCFTLSPCEPWGQRGPPRLQALGRWPAPCCRSSCSEHLSHGVVVAAIGLTAAAILVVGRDDERRSLAWEASEQ